MPILNLIIILSAIFFGFIFTERDGSWRNSVSHFRRKDALSVVLLLIIFNIFGPWGTVAYFLKITLDIFLLSQLGRRSLKFFILYEISLVIAYKYFFPDLSFLENFGLGYQLLAIIGFAIDQVSLEGNERSFAIYFSQFRSFLIPSFYLAGPIEKIQTLSSYIEKPKKVDFTLAAALISSGVIKLSMKTFFGSIDLNMGSLYTMLMTTLFFYLDLSSYSDIISGVSLFFGIPLTNNFNLPFIKTSISSMWRNWHVSLNNWFIEYVFEPVVFSKRIRSFSPLARYIAGVLITFLLIGMWHRISLNFFVWATLIALLVIIEQVLRTKKISFPGWLGIPYVLLSMGFARYIIFLPSSGLETLGMRIGKLFSAEIFPHSSVEEGFSIVLVTSAFVVFSVLDYYVIRKPQVFSRTYLTYGLVFVAAFIYLTCYVPQASSFSYGRM